MAALDPNSMFVWLPKVVEAGIPHPRTVMLEVDRWKLTNCFDPDEETDAALLRTIAETAEAFGYPLFLRTDLASGKHSWNRSCYIPSREVLIQHVGGVIEANEMANVVGLDYAGLAFRELLELDSTFTAFDGMPVARERRYFAAAGVVQCRHAYWFEGAIERSWWEKPPDWKERLALLNDESTDPPELAEWASRVTRLLPGAWSVDFACLRDRRHWVLIDMALAHQSWHPEHTP